MSKQLSIDKLVELKVKSEMSKYQLNHRRISDEWLKLRNEISNYIQHEMMLLTEMSYVTCQNAIYNPIKIILGVNRIDDITGAQTVIAKQVFLYIKNMTEKYNKKARIDSATRLLEKLESK
ncbi:hypothetical protein [Melissococcus plutonius]|uniref:hypothetical protein n=2 Tax=Melissococcus plutonius TaxID=33970 RepID=UPI003C30D497